MPASIVIERAWSSVSDGDWLSVTLTVKLLVPDAVGVPLIVPFDAPSERPAGSEPETMRSTKRGGYTYLKQDMTLEWREDSTPTILG